MGHITREHADSLGGQGIFFKLEDDGDSAIIRFPYLNLDDLFDQCFYRVHEINSQTPDYKTVDCLIETPDDPIDICPFCEQNQKAVAKLFIQVYDEKEDTMKLWVSSKARIKDFNAHLLDEDLKGKKLMEAKIKVIRDGKKGDNNTRYNFKIMEFTDVELEDFPELIDLYESKALLKLNADDMDKFLRNGRLPNSQQNNSNSSNNKEAARRRLGSRDQGEEKPESRRSTRRNLGGNGSGF